jgi:hypothetical protein
MKEQQLESGFSVFAIRPAGDQQLGQVTKTSVKSAKKNRKSNAPN